MKSTARFWLTLCLAAGAVGGGGCSFFRSIAGFKRPSIAFKSASLSEVSLSGATLELTYLVDNPNPVALPLNEVSYRLSVEGKPVVAGQPKKGLRIPARGKGELVFPAQLKFADIAPALEAFLSKDRARYRAEGNVGVESPVGVLRLPLAHEGAFEVPKVPDVQFGTPRIGQLSLTGAAVEIPLRVTNRNSFPLAVAALAGALKIAGSDVGALATDALGTLGPHATQEISLPLAIQFRGAAAAAAALRRGRGELAFSGSLRSGQTAMPIEWKAMRQFER